MQPLCNRVCMARKRTGNQEPRILLLRHFFDIYAETWREGNSQSKRCDQMEMPKVSLLCMARRNKSKLARRTEEGLTMAAMEDNGPDSGGRLAIPNEQPMWLHKVSGAIQRSRRDDVFPPVRTDSSAR